MQSAAARRPSATGPRGVSPQLASRTVGEPARAEFERFPKPRSGQVAVRIITHTGAEMSAVLEIPPK